MQQRTPDWIAARLGKVTASRVADVIARIKSGYGASRANYGAQLVCERLTGLSAESYQSGPMQWGSEKEPEARQLYEFEFDALVATVGFLSHPTISSAGASPDGLVGEAGLIEIKCPITSTHIDTFIGAAPAARYLTQMQWQMAVTGRAWCDFVSYDPRLPVDMQLFVMRVDRDDQRIAELEAEVRAFLAEVQATVARLTERHAARFGIAAERDGEDVELVLAFAQGGAR